MDTDVKRRFCDAVRAPISGRQAIASAAPEPETYLMMLLGLGGVGYATRLRRKGGRSDA